MLSYFLHQLALLKNIWKAQLLGFMELKKDDPIMATTNFFGSIINIYPSEDGNEKILLLDFGSCF